MHSHHDHSEGAASASAAGELTEVEAARQILAQEEQRRMEACAAEIKEVLERHGMRLDVSQPQIVLAPAS
jgi:metal-dependent hydrolase (beta-lactamase superfamily II)